MAILPPTVHNAPLNSPVRVIDSWRGVALGGQTPGYRCEQAVECGVFPVELQCAALSVPGQPAPALQVPADAGRDGLQQLVRLGPGRRRHPPELEPVMTPDVDRVQHQQVEVDIQVQRAAEALDQGHGAGLRGWP